MCLRCTFLYSLCWVHANLTAETHDAMHEMMGVANLEMMEHLAECASHEKLVDVNGRRHVPARTSTGCRCRSRSSRARRTRCGRSRRRETTYDALVEQFPDDATRYRRHVIPGYGHLDTVFGKNAVHDTYPKMLDHLVRAGA